MSMIAQPVVPMPLPAGFGYTGRLRFMEVKGRHAAARTVTNTRDEVLIALDAADAYILAIAVVENGSAHLPIYLPDPAYLCGPVLGFADV